MFFFSLILILYLFPRQAKFKYEFTKGKPWLHETIIAPFDFSILKSESDLDKEKEIVKSQHLSLYNFNKNIFDIKAEDFINEFEEKWSENKGTKKDLRFTFKNLFKNRKKLANNKKNNLASFGFNFLNEIYSVGIIQLNSSVDNQNYDRILLKNDLIAWKI